MDILKNAKGNFVKLERLLEGVDSKYLKGGFYFPRSDLPDNVYDELWAVIKREMGEFRQKGELKTGGFDAYPQVDGNNDYSKTPENYTYKLKIKTMVPPTLQQKASWEGALVKPEYVKDNWKKPDSFEEYEKRLRQLEEFKRAFPDIPPTSRFGSPKENPRFTRWRKEFDEWVKENMVENPKKDATMRNNPMANVGLGVQQHRKRGRGLFEDIHGVGVEETDELTGKKRKYTSRHLPFDLSQSTRKPSQKEWDAVHSGFFILKVFHKKAQMININIKLDTGFRMPPTNMNLLWDKEKNRPSKLSQKKPNPNQRLGDNTPNETGWNQTNLDWRQWYADYDKHTETKDYANQVKLQKALASIFDLAQNYKTEADETLTSLFG